MIRAQGLCKSYADKQLLKNVDFLMPQKGRIAIVGRNGCGKTTLLAMLLGHEEPDAGRVTFPNLFRVGALAQESNAHPAPTVLEEAMAGAQRLVALESRVQSLMQLMAHDHSPELHDKFLKAEDDFRALGGLRWRAQTKMILRGLGFSEDGLNCDPRTLSGGWRMRIELAKLLIDPPDVLFLDEPTNHLDLPSILWLESFLLNFPGLVVFVSHDRDFLNKLATEIWHLHGGLLDCYVGNFSSFLEQREQKILQREQQKQALELKKNALEEFVSRFGAKASKAAQAQSRLKMLERLRSLEQDDLPGEEPQLALSRLPCAPSGKVTLTVEDLAVGFGQPLVLGLDLSLTRGQRLAVLGPNGIGKSSLLKTLAGEITALSGKVNFGHGVQLGYFAQDQRAHFPENESVLNALLRYIPQLTPFEARSLLGRFLFRENDVLKSCGVLSGGELSRLGLACLLGSGCNLLLLDEPTNHLDMASAEALAAYLVDFPGTVIFVSHERAFVEEVSTHVLGLTGAGEWVTFLGGMKEYETWLTAEFKRPSRAAADSGLGSSAPLALDNKQRFQLQKDMSRLEKRSKQLEEAQDDLSQKIRVIQDQLCSEGQDYQNLNAQKKQHEEDLEQAEGQWFQIQEEMEKLKVKLNAGGGVG